MVPWQIVFSEEILAHESPNLQLSPEDCVAASKDFELKIRLVSGGSIGFRGLEAEIDPPDERYQNLMFQVEIFIGDFGCRLFAFWPIPGECFAPF